MWGGMSDMNEQSVQCSRFEKTCAATQKNVKSHVFWILKKNVKKRKKTCVCPYSFTGHLITQPLIHNYRKSVPVSHRRQTSCSEMGTQEIMQLRTVCDKRRSNSMFNDGSEWITLRELGIELQ